MAGVAWRGDLLARGPQCDQVAQLTADVKPGAAGMLRCHQFVEHQPKLRSLDMDKLEALDRAGRKARRLGNRHRPAANGPAAAAGRGKATRDLRSPETVDEAEGVAYLQPISARERFGCAGIRDNFFMPSAEESALGIETGASMRATIARKI